MKARLTAVLSLTGVLAAGTAAALVNTQVLQSAGSSDDNVLVTTGSTVPDTTATSPDPTVLTVDTTVPAATQAAYQIGDAGVVVLDTAGDVLTVVSATPSAGWLVAEIEHKDPLNVEVKFQAGTITVEFSANLLFGVVSTSVESKDSNAPSSSSGSGDGASGSVTTVDDHGGDDGDDNSGPGSGSGSDDDNSGPGGGGDDD